MKLSDQLWAATSLMLLVYMCFRSRIRPDGAASVQKGFPLGTNVASKTLRSSPTGWPVVLARLRSGSVQHVRPFGASLITVLKFERGLER
jgi:hypothetical protein